MNKLHTGLSLLVLLAWIPLQAEPAYFPAVMNLSADSTSYILVVDKTDQEMHLIKSPRPGALEIIKTYRVTTGRVNGNKEVEGDLKTPEGIYRVIDLLPGENLLPKYGPLAFVLNYPNFADRKFGRTGGGIWIHGRDEEIQDFLTEGCVSLRNDQILELQQYITLRETQVVIEDSLQPLDSSGYERQIKEWESKIDTWADAWESGDTEQYFSFYSPIFRDGELDLEGFKRKKRSLERTYDWKRVNVKDAVVLSSETETKISFFQEYYCPNFYSEGVKTLTMIPNDHHWKIIGEDYTRTAPTLRKEAFLSAFVREWERKWESGNFNRYITLYDSTFHNKDYDYQGWYDYKQSVLSEADDISVDISDLTYRSSGDMEWEVSFKQDYRAADYSDYGRKTLRIYGYPDNLKIIAEDWRPLAQNE
ncbi:MAG: L,D-transpeptidase family protein [Candidatus Marinimicrobia bacterium]|nr:L,D-transpeptidase family protein [Candidatus Neomarinimicrobiota bacterium]MCF7828942.1 L,D-transpeptidase family protein [Candidatus Neomarinimicrobiota bacterium]MCF7879902.1 L,D-transpeptidase family protein [Candidatus Neomarinimicrobiota bacterium]